MKNTVELYTKKKVIHQTQMTGGFSFETWLLTLEDNCKIIFRTGKDTGVENGKEFNVSNIFEKEDFFYKTVNQKFYNRCPEIYLIDNSKEIFEQPYQIMSFVEGVSLEKYLINIDEINKNKIFKQMGQVTAEINSIEINNPVGFYQGENWELKLKKMLIERMAPLLRDNLLTESEEMILLNHLSELKAKKTNSLLHLDMRLPNLIYNNEKIHVIDAENCDVGDPLYELAIVSVAGLLDDYFMEGYKEKCDFSFELDNPLFKYYQFERLAALVNLFKNIIRNESLTQSSINSFERLKRELIW